MDAKQAVRVDAIRASVTVFQVLDHYRVQYSGKVTQQIRCPVHLDRTPSARVYADKNTVYCFTCAKFWDVIELVRAKEACDFGTALDWLETQFLVPPASANLTQVLRGQLRRKSEPSPDLLYDMVESRLIANRERMGLVRYSKALLALDLVYAQVKARQITSDEYTEITKAVLQFLGRALK